MRFAAGWLLAIWPLCAAEVPIGYFGPASLGHPLGGALWQGLTLAIEEANREGGYEGAPFRIVPDWDENPWTGGAAAVTRMVYKDRVVAIIGGIDGTSTHLAEQVVVKGMLALIDPASTDRSVNAAFVPWMYSLMPDDRVLMAVLGAAVLASPEAKSYLVVSATDHDSRVMAGEFLAFMSRHRSRPLRRIEFRSGSPMLHEVVEAGTSAVIVLANALDSAALVRELPGRTVFGGPAMGRSTFLLRAGASADGVRFPLPLAHTPPERFVDYSSVYAYDAARLLVDAIRKVGPDRARLRDTLREMSPWEGLSGRIEWDKLGRNTGHARMVEIRQNRIQTLPQNEQ